MSFLGLADKCRLFSLPVTALAEAEVIYHGKDKGRVLRVTQTTSKDSNLVKPQIYHHFPHWDIWWGLGKCKRLMIKIQRWSHLLAGTEGGAWSERGRWELLVMTSMFYNWLWEVCTHTCLGGWELQFSRIEKTPVLSFPCEPFLWASPWLCTPCTSLLTLKARERGAARSGENGQATLTFQGRKGAAGKNLLPLGTEWRPREEVAWKGRETPAGGRFCWGFWPW